MLEALVLLAVSFANVVVGVIVNDCAAAIAAPIRTMMNRVIERCFIKPHREWACERVQLLRISVAQKVLWFTGNRTLVAAVTKSASSGSAINSDDDPRRSHRRHSAYICACIAVRCQHSRCRFPAGLQIDGRD